MMDQMNRRQALAGIGLGVTGIVLCKPKMGMSDMVPALHLPGESVISKKNFEKLKELNCHIPINLTVIETNKTEYLFNCDLNESITVPLNDVDKCGPARGKGVYDPAYELYHAICQSIKWCGDDFSPINTKLKWFLLRNDEKKLVGTCWGENLRIPGTPLNTMICDGKWHEAYIEGIHFYPSYEWWKIATRRREF